MSTVLFVCRQNAGRSQMSHALFERAAGGRHGALSAGTTPAEHVHPEVIQVMNEVGLDVSGRPQVLPPDALDHAALIVTFSDERALRRPAAVPEESWDLPDPRGLSLDRLRELRDRLRERVWRLVARQGWYKLQPVRMLRFSAEQRQQA